ncbi:MAG: DUF547 domain-containing protein [Myxococcales bacterium]|nr:DUF547 domain-containing protein [Myxococcales bacterium]
MPSLFRRAALFVAASALLISLGARDARAVSHKPFDKILRKYVRGGRVDYAGIKANAQKQLDAYVASVGKSKPGGSKKAKLAFYINAYNATVIKAIVDRYPISSVMKVKGFFDKVKHKIAGRMMTLNQLENGVIRPTFKDARVHFALVCGARSCPPLMSRAFSAARVDKDLDRLTATFLKKNHHGVRIKGGDVHVSKLFQWYKKDFVANAGSVNKFITKYRRGVDAPKIATSTLKFLPYSWALNKK